MSLNVTVPVGPPWPDADWTPAVSSTGWQAPDVKSVVVESIGVGWKSSADASGVVPLARPPATRILVKNGVAPNSVAVWPLRAVDMLFTVDQVSVFGS